MIRSKCPECRKDEHDKPVESINATFRQATHIIFNRFWDSVLTFKDDKLCERHNHD